MANNLRWTRNDELMLVKNIRKGGSIENIASSLNRSNNATALRLKKIIHDNHNAGKSFGDIARLTNLPSEKITQYYYSYADFLDKHNQNQSHKLSSLKSEKIQSGGAINKTNAETKIKKIELQNKLMKLIVDNKILSTKVKQLIATKKIDGKVVDAMKNIIKNKLN